MNKPVTVFLSAFLLSSLISSPSVIHAGPLPDTGQTKCYNNTNEIPCPAPGQAFYGQDAQYTINPPSYTKLGSYGEVLSDDAASWTMIRDNVTGLIWENKTNDGSIHDGSKRFTWCDRNPATNGGNQGACGTGTGDAATDTDAFVKALNAARFGGFFDWRLPTAKEVVSIVDYSRTNPSINTAWYPNTWSSFYWSSTTTANDSTKAWYVNLDYSFVNISYKSSANALRAVRGRQLENRYVDNGDGTVSDTKTGLMWQKEKQSGIGMSWQASLEYVKTITLAGFEDWRLPNIVELQSLADYGRSDPAIDTSVFHGSWWPYASAYFSSTTSANSSNNALDVYFFSGYVSNTDKPGSTPDVRGVRGGQSRSLGSLFISAPAQAARLEIGQTQSIVWDTVGIVGNVRITLSRQGGKPGSFTETIAENVPNSGSYLWNVTGPETFNAALRIEPLSDATKGATQGLFSVAQLLSAGLTAEKVGDTAHYRLTLTGQYKDGSWPTPAVFASSDNSVATVDAYDYLTAQNNGYVEVSASFNGFTDKKVLFVYANLDTGESEGNNTKETADVMAPSGADASISRFYKGALTSVDTDWFKFTLGQGAIVNVGFLSQSSTADVKIDLYGTADTLLASATSMNGAHLILPVGLPAGDYYLKLTPAGDIDQTGNYIVAWKTLGSLPAKAAIPISLGETKTGVINTLADSQEITFGLASESVIKFLFSPSSPTAKYRLNLLDAGQTVIDGIDCLEQKPVSFQATYGAGSYTLRVTPLDVVDSQNPFSLSLTGAEGQLEKEPNDTVGQATAFDIARPMTGRLSSVSDGDFFSFSLDTPRFLELKFAAPGSTGNYSLTLFKESDAYEIDGIDIANGLTTSLHMGLGAGRYYLRVKGGASNVDTIHNYTLTFADSTQTDLEIESNNTLKVANAIDKAQAKRGRIYSAQDKDYYGFHFPEGGFITMTFTPSTSTGDYKVSLVDDNYEKTSAALYAYTSTNGEVINATDLFIENPGNYYVKVEANGDIDQYKPYSLNLTSNVAIVGLKQLVNVAVMGTKTTMTVSDTQTLTAKAGYSDASIANVTPTWTSLNPAVASVNGAGVVTAVAEGATSIVASYGGVTGKFDFTVGAPVNVVKQHYGNLILVAGGGIADTNTLKESTQYLSDLVYRRFKARLFGDEDIYYFNPMPFHDINGDGFGENIVDETAPTVAKFGNAITQWAASQSTDGPLYIYLIDHGGIDNFMIYPGEIVTADQLKTYLDTFQTATGRKVVVIIEACKSGSFTDNLAAQGQNRVVVTSTDSQDAYIQLGGRISFSQFFADQLLTGASIHQSYLKAKNQLANMGLPYSGMRPQLVEGVSNAAVQTMIGGDFAIASLFPEITETSASKSIQANTNQGFYAKISSLEGIESVWAVVIPPDYVAPATSGDLMAPQVSLPTIELADPDKDRTYDGSYNAFTKNGDYRITFYARNANGNVTVYSPQTVVTVSGGMEPGKTLSVTKSGTGAGTITSQPVGIDCGSDCSESYNTPVSVMLTATAAQGSTFVGWTGGGCSGTASCTVTMDTTLTIDAGFALNSGTITGRVSANVLGYTDLGVRNATVTLEDTSYSVSPDADGNFNLQNIPYGNYTMAISAPNMETVTRAISVTGASQQVTLPAMNLLTATGGVKGDANDDGHLGLEDVVYMLQVLSGTR